MSRVGIKLVVTLSVVAVLVLAITLLVSLPLRFFVGDSINGIDYTDINGASLIDGDLWLNHHDFPGLIHVSYKWCPGLSLLAWCADIDHTSIALDGRFLVSLSQELEAEALTIEFVDMAAIGVAGGLVDSRVSGHIEELSMSLNGCPLQQIHSIEGSLKTTNIGVFGVSLGEHQLALANSTEGIQANLSGETFNGIVEMNDAQYSAQGEMNAPDSIAPMMRNLMRPLGDNRFGWGISGAIPC